MPIAALHGFEIPKHKRFDENFAAYGTLEGGGVINPHDVADFQTIPYAANGYEVGILNLGNTGFNRIRFQDALPALTTRVVVSTWIKFAESFNDPGTNNMGESGFLVFRNGGQLGVKVAELAVRQNPAAHTYGSIELWSTTNPADQFNYTGTKVAETSPTTVVTKRWYWMEVVFDSGTVTVMLDNVVVLTGSALSTAVNRVGLEWESYGFRQVMFDDTIVQYDADATVFGAPMRITTIRVSSDKITEWPATTYNGSGHYAQVREVYNDPYWYSVTQDVNSYLTYAAGRELFAFSRCTPIGSIVAVAPVLTVMPESLTVPSTVKVLCRNTDTGELFTSATITTPVYIARETTQRQRNVSATYLMLRDPLGNLWQEDDWIGGGWQFGVSAGGGPGLLTHYDIERLHSLGGGSGSRYISY